MADKLTPEWLGLLEAAIKLSDALHASELAGRSMSASVDDAWERLSMSIEQCRCVITTPGGGE